jgi:hypothetical protein
MVQIEESEKKTNRNKSENRKKADNLNCLIKNAFLHINKVIFSCFFHYLQALFCFSVKQKEKKHKHI